MFDSDLPLDDKYDFSEDYREEELLASVQGIDLEAKSAAITAFLGSINHYSMDRQVAEIRSHYGV